MLGRIWLHFHKTIFMDLNPNMMGPIEKFVFGGLFFALVIYKRTLCLWNMKIENFFLDTFIFFQIHHRLIFLISLYLSLLSSYSQFPITTLSLSCSYDVARPSTVGDQTTTTNRAFKVDSDNLSSC